MARQIVVLALAIMALFALVSTAAAAPAPAPGGSPSGSPGDVSSPPPQASTPSPSSGAALEVSAIAAGAAAVASYFIRPVTSWPTMQQLVVKCELSLQVVKYELSPQVSKSEMLCEVSKCGMLRKVLKCDLALFPEEEEDATEESSACYSYRADLTLKVGRLGTNGVRIGWRGGIIRYRPMILWSTNHDGRSFEPCGGNTLVFEHQVYRDGKHGVILYKTIAERCYGISVRPWLEYDVIRSPLGQYSQGNLPRSLACERRMGFKSIYGVYSWLGEEVDKDCQMG
ncbi:hypothetical protein Gotur_002353 [Gossypium turneri]